MKEKGTAGNNTSLIKKISEQSLNMALQIAHMGCWEWDIQDNSEIWSDELLRIFGYNPGEVEPSHDLFLKSIHPDDRERVLKTLENALASIEQFKVEFRIILPDKAERILKYQGEVFRDKDSNPLKVVGIVTDLTEHKMLHTKLMSVNSSMKALIENVDDMICSRDKERALVSWNKTFAESIKTAFGVNPFIGMRTVDYLSPDQRNKFNRFSELYNRVLSGEHIKEEFEYRLPDGIVNYYEIAWSPIRDGNDITGVAEITRNITKRKLQEMVLKKSNERFSAFIKNSSEAIWCLDLKEPLNIHLSEEEQVDHIFRNAYFLEVNDSYARMLGYESGNELVGRYLREVMPPSMTESKETAKHYVKEKYNVVDMQSIEITRQGERRVFLNNIQGVIEDGYLLRAWGTERDITNQKKIENELMRNEKDLQKLAGRLILNQEEELSRLARELHDDLTQQLAVTSIEAGQLEQDFKDLPAPVLQRIVRIKEQLIKASKDVHNMSRDLHPSILKDLGLERAVKSECGNFSARTGIAVIFTPENVSENIPENIALSIYRIIQEGLSNIVKHADTKNAYVFLEGSDHNILLTVRDTGVGFDNKDVRSKAAMGFGSIRERARLVNGTSSITSSPGKGTTIEVKIPLKRE
jgi:PAS domain S-box-containing protein